MIFEDKICEYLDLKDEFIKYWGKIDKEAFYNLYPTPNIDGIIDREVRLDWQMYSMHRVNE
jgi:hypothetical protein